MISEGQSGVFYSVIKGEITNPLPGNESRFRRKGRSFMVSWSMGEVNELVGNVKRSSRHTLRK